MLLDARSYAISSQLRLIFIAVAHLFYMQEADTESCSCGVRNSVRETAGAAAPGLTDTALAAGHSSCSSSARALIHPR